MSYPSGSELRKLAKAASRARQTGHWYDLLEELYIFGFALIVLVSMMIPALSDSSAGVWGGNQVSWASPDFAEQRAQATWLIWGALSMLGLWVAQRIGPLTATAGIATWLLPSPADRRGLLWPRTIAVMLLATGWGLIAGLMSGALALDSGHGFILATLLWWSVLGAGFQFLLTMGSLVAQSASTRLWARALVLAPAAVAVSFTFLAPTLIFDAAAHLGVLGAGLVVLAVGAGCCWFLGVQRIDKIATTALRRGGVLLATSQAAISDLNIRNLMSVLAPLGAAQTWWRRLGIRLSASWRLVRGPATATFASDAALMIRNPRHLVQYGASVGAVWLICTASLSKPVVALGVIVLSFIGALSVTGGARHADDSPSWDRYFPTSANDSRRHRLYFPLAMMLGWWAATAAVLVHTSGSQEWWAIVLTAAPVAAAAALRSAFRPAPNWNAPLIATPMGAFPPSLISGVSHGLDLLILGSVPLILALLGIISPSLLNPLALWIQLTLSILMCGWAIRVGKRAE